MMTKIGRWHIDLINIIAVYENTAEPQFNTVVLGGGFECNFNAAELAELKEHLGTAKRKPEPELYGIATASDSNMLMYGPATLAECLEQEPNSEYEIIVKLVKNGTNAMTYAAIVPSFNRHLKAAYVWMEV